MSQYVKKLFLLDAYALIYRAHFAFSQNPRISSKGINTSVMFGFTNTLLEVLQKQKPTHIAVVFDTSAPTFRHEQYAGYKSNREETPEDIKIGIPVTKEIIKAFNIPVLELDGYEADDIIGTLAKKGAKQGFEVYMMTPDKDFGQLVEEKIFLYKPAYMGNAVDIMGVEEICAKWDIEKVSQVTDMLGLQGDAVDNIPGIPGVGPKTAAKFIRQFGSVEGLIANTDRLKGKIKEKVEQFAQQGLLSKQLATINTAVPVDFNEEQLKYTKPDKEKLQPIFEELEFKTLLRRVFNIESPKSPVGQLSLFDFANDSQKTAEPGENTASVLVLDTIETVKHTYTLIEKQAERVRLIEELERQKEFCFDTETTGIDAVEARVVGLSFSFKKSEAYYVAVPHDREPATAVICEFKHLLEDPSKVKVGQNVKYDALVLKKYGVEVQAPVFDTMLAHYLIEPEARHGMDAIAEHYLNYSPVPITSLIGPKGKKQKNMADLTPAEISDYACEDADITLQLKQKLSQEIETLHLHKLLYDVEQPLALVLAEMENEGVKIDEAALEAMSGELQKESLKVQQEIYNIAGQEFNIASPKQLGEILFDKLKLAENPKKTKTGQYATGEDILSRLANEHAIAGKILEFREYQKLKSTYVDALPKMISPGDGRVHTDYGQAIAATGRLSSNNPNLQNIPIRTTKGREIRKAFIPRDDDHLLLSADYSQIELRIAASFAQDEHMIEAFKTGRDIHATTAAKVFEVNLDQVTPGMRRKAKEVNFGIIYGISAFGLSQNLHIPRSEAGEIIKAYFKEFNAIKTYMDACIEKARKQQYVETIMGRRRYLRDINSRNATMRGYAERNAINAPIQGSAADIIKKAMVDIRNWLKADQLNTKMIMQVHDELVFDVPKAEVDKVKPKIIELMMNAVVLKVPLEVEAGVGENWLQAH